MFVMNRSSWLCLWRLTLALALVGINSTLAADTAIISSNTITSSKPGCENKCGEVIIPYPFGIGTGCFLNPSYEILCNSSKPCLAQAKVEVYNISYEDVRVASMMTRNCYDSNGVLLNNESISFSIQLEGTPYTFSEYNMLTIIGCDDVGVIMAMEGSAFTTGCLSICSEARGVVDGVCSGYGCCQTSIPKGITQYLARMRRLQNLTREITLNANDNFSFKNCSYALVAENSSFTFNGEKDFIDPIRTLSDRAIMTKYPVVLDWVLGKPRSLNCSEAQRVNDYECKGNTDCVDSGTGFIEQRGGYRCKCNDGYEGNPYLAPGCRDINECANTKNECVHQNTCKNTPGNYTCSCPKGYSGDGIKTKSGGTGCDRDQFPIIQLSLGLSFGLLSLLVGITWFYLWHEKRKLIKKRAMFFQQNGGLLMNQQFASNKGGVQSTKIFTAQELEKATNKYADEMILGRGGYGTVYKGILPDQTIVAIKKSKISDESQIEQFINEVIILVQINHRNVVKLLGCCLEAEVPLLVYEYVSNGTLLQHIPDNAMTWENRLRIATEAAGSLAYLHSATSKPIIHRDVKSANILLDECYTAKMADFGASRLVPLDQVHVTTLVQGTIGYLDPEYFQTGQLTEKSDVYSFGVVLAELLTGQAHISIERELELRSLATYFLVSMKENRLFQILEPRVIREGSLEQLQACAELVKRCLQLNGDDRPTMKEVEMKLDSLRKYNIMHPRSTNSRNCDQQINVCLMSEMNEANHLPLILNASHLDQFSQYNSSQDFKFFGSTGPR